MIAAWVIYAATVGVLLGLFALAAEGVARQLRVPARWSWLGSMLLVAGLTVAAGWRVTLPTGAPAIAAGGGILAPSTTPTTAVAMSGLARLLDVMSAVLRAAVAEIASRVPASIAFGALTLWLIAGAAALGLLVFVHRRLDRARRRWPAADLHGTRVRVAPTVGPAVVGVVDAEIVVPRWLLQRAAEEQRMVVAHEAEHLRGRDHLALAAGCLAVALVPWHPAMWWMLRRLRLAIELECDARVLRRGIPPSTYGTTLIDLAGQCTGFRIGATALAEQGTHLERRIRAMNSTPQRRSLVRTGALCAAAVVVLLAACEAKVPTSAEIGAMDVAGAQRSLQMMPATHGEKAIFYIDGKEADGRAAHALTANQIATIKVAQGATANDPTTIRISTTGEAAAREPQGGLVRMHNALHSMIAGGGSPTKEKIRTPGPDNTLMSGLLILNGAVVDRAALAGVNPATIKNVEVMKGSEAVKMYSSPLAANGVVKITTR